jgi:hypothetical protein
MSYRDNPIVTMVLDLQHDKHRLAQERDALQAQVKDLVSLCDKWHAMAIGWEDLYRRVQR